MPSKTDVPLRPVQVVFLFYLFLAGLLTADLAFLMAHNPAARAWTLGDWGRWLYIHTLCIALLLFAIERERQRSAVTTTSTNHNPKRSILRLVTTLALLLYTLTWNLPHVPADPNHHGYTGMLLTAAHSAPR